MQWMRISCVQLLLVSLVALPQEVLAEDYYDCRQFDDRSLCKQLNRFPAVKDLPVFEAGRVLSLYRDKEDYAEQVLEDRPVVLRGRISQMLEHKGKFSVLLGELDASSESHLRLQLFSRHPVAAEQARVASRSDAELIAQFKPGQVAVFQCVGDGVSGSVPVFVNCIFWE